MINGLASFLDEYPGSIEDTAKVYTDDPFSYSALAMIIKRHFGGTPIQEHYPIFELLLSRGASGESPIIDGLTAAEMIRKSTSVHVKYWTDIVNEFTNALREARAKSTAQTANIQSSSAVAQSVVKSPTQQQVSDYLGAAFHGNKEEVLNFIDEYPEHINARELSRSNFTALHRAIDGLFTNGNEACEEIFNLLLERGADPKVTSRVRDKDDRMQFQESLSNYS